MSLPGKKIAVNGVNYHVFDQGDSDRVVMLLHGMPDTSDVWRHQVPALLAAGYRVIAPDLLGYGETDKPAEYERYTAELLIGDLLALIETLQLPPLDLVAHDWGSILSWELVSHFPQLFKRYITLQVGHPGVMFKDTSTTAVKESWYMYLNTERDSAELYAMNDCEFLRKTMMPSHPELDKICARLKDPAVMNGMLNWDRANQMATFFLAHMKGELTYEPCTVPTMGIWSAGDEYCWRSQVEGSDEFMAAQWRFVPFDEGSHWLMLDKPDEVNSLILEWLAASPG